MALRVLIANTDEMFGELFPFYQREVTKGNIEIVGFGRRNGGVYECFSDPWARNKIDLGNISAQVAIISAMQNYHNWELLLRSMGVPRENIIDGRVFRAPGFDSHRFWHREGVVCTLSEKELPFKHDPVSIYPHTFL